MITLDDLRLMRALHDTGSLAASARLLDLTPPALTVRLKKLEDRLGVHLAVRGARGVSLTDEGRRLYEEAAELLDRVESLPERISREAGAMTGHLRVVAPLGFGREYVAPIIRDLRMQHPSLTLTLDLSDSPLRDAAGHDLVIHIGAIRDSSWIGHLLAPNKRILCASPKFVRALKHRPADPADLQQLDCLCLRENDDDITRWRFVPATAAGRAAAQRPVTVRVGGPLSSNDGEVIRRWALDGLGIMARSEWDVAPLLDSGQLVQLLPAWELEPSPILALVPSRKGTSARLRGFIEAAKAAINPPPWHRARRGRFR